MSEQEEEEEEEDSWRRNVAWRRNQLMLKKKQGWEVGVEGVRTLLC